jgi:hypothetical protein
VKPDAAFHNDAAGTIVVMSPGDDTITSIDARTHAVVGTMKLAGQSGIRGQQWQGRRVRQP